MIFSKIFTLKCLESIYGIHSICKYSRIATAENFVLLIITQKWSPKPTAHRRVPSGANSHKAFLSVTDFLVTLQFSDAIAKSFRIPSKAKQSLRCRRSHLANTSSAPRGYLVCTSSAPGL